MQTPKPQGPLLARRMSVLLDLLDLWDLSKTAKTSRIYNKLFASRVDRP
jgi:hypothetical protein